MPGQSVHQQNTQAVEPEGHDMKPDIIRSETKPKPVENQMKKRAIRSVLPNVVIYYIDKPLTGRNVLIIMEVIK